MKTGTIKVYNLTTRTRFWCYLTVLVVAALAFSIFKNYAKLFIYGSSLGYVYMQLTVAAVLIIVFPVIHFLKHKDTLAPVNLFVAFYCILYNS